MGFTLSFVVLLYVYKFIERNKTVVAMTLDNARRHKKGRQLRRQSSRAAEVSAFLHIILTSPRDR